MKDEKLINLLDSIKGCVYQSNAGLEQYIRELQDSSNCSSPLWEINKLIDQYVKEENLKVFTSDSTIDSMVELDWQILLNEDKFNENVADEIESIVLDKMDNLCGGGQISDYLYHKIENNLEYYEDYISSCIADNLEDYEDEIKFCMKELYEQYEEDEIEKMDLNIYDAIYNCDGIWLEIIADKFLVDADDLSDYDESEEDEE